MGRVFLLYLVALLIFWPIVLSESMYVLSPFLELCSSRSLLSSSTLFLSCLFSRFCSLYLISKVAKYY